MWPKQAGAGVQQKLEHAIYVLYGVNDRPGQVWLVSGKQKESLISFTLG